LKKFLTYINTKVLVESGGLNSVNLSLKIITGIVISKFVAVFIGAEGMALIGNLRNFLSAAQTAAIAGFYNGVVKLLNECKSNVKELSRTLSSVFYFGFFTSMLLSFGCYYNAENINDFIFSYQYNYAYVIETLALVLPFYALNMFIFSIMNGFSKYKILLIINILGQVLGLLITILLIWQDNIDGALIAVVIVPALSLLISVVGILSRKNFMSLIKITKVDFSVVKVLQPYMLIALVTTIAMPLTLIFIRNYIINEIGIKEAGYWQAMNRISYYYLLFVNSIMTLYVLPRLTELDTKQAFRKEIFGFYRNVVPVFGLVLVLIYLGRSLLVPILLSEEFEPVETLFGFQIMGDFLKVIATVITYQFLAKKMFYHFIILEVFLFIILYISSVYFIDIFGLEGAVIGHFLSYLMYFGMVLLLFSSSLFGILPEDTIND